MELILNIIFYIIIGIISIEATIFIVLLFIPKVEYNKITNILFKLMLIMGISLVPLGILFIILLFFIK